ncbi:MAG: GDSL-type esterase/lipase family protein [Hyphomicrobiaceae bacterium]|nr:GDSL-type esterase/lipase family protein [Hyphomicrobiaceae bacterium]
MWAVLAVKLAAGVALAQSSLHEPPLPPTSPPAVPKECGVAASAATPLPNSAVAIQARGTLRILAIGAAMRPVVGTARDGKPPLLERILEHTIKGLNVEIINRGFSGELAAATAERLKIEVALEHPDVVLWQVGTNDAFAQVPVEEFETTVQETVRWLKEHNIDVILVGLHYMKHLAKSEYYQAIRESLARIAQAEGVLRIRRYEAQEFLERAMRMPGQPEPGVFGYGEPGYNCMAQYLAHGIAVGLYAKPATKLQAPSKTIPK